MTRLHDIDELMKLNWTYFIEYPANGGVALRIEELEDFAIFAEDEDVAIAELSDALRSHLLGYINTGKVVPHPAITHRIVQPDESDDATRGDDWRSYRYDATEGILQKREAVGR